MSKTQRASVPKELVVSVLQAIPTGLPESLVEAHLKSGRQSHALIRMVLGVDPAAVDLDALDELLYPKPEVVKQLKKDGWWVVQCTEEVTLDQLMEDETLRLGWSSVQTCEHLPVQPGWYAIHPEHPDISMIKRSGRTLKENMVYAEGISRVYYNRYKGVTPLNLPSVEEVLFVLRDHRAKGGKGVMWLASAVCRNRIFGAPDAIVGLTNDAGQVNIFGVHEFATDTCFVDMLQIKVEPSTS